MLKQIQEIKKLLAILEEGMTAATPPSTPYKKMTDRELLLDLAIICRIGKIILPLELYNEVKERTKNV